MVITSVSAVNAYFAQKMWASAGSHLQIPIREIIMDAFLSLVVIVLFSICICRQNAQWLKYQLIFLGETFKKNPDNYLCEGNLEWNTIFFGPT